MRTLLLSLLLVTLAACDTGGLLIVEPADAGCSPESPDGGAPEDCGADAGE